MATILRRRKLGFVSVKRICEESRTGINWVRNDAIVPEDNLYIRWGCTSELPNKSPVLNTAKAIHLTSNKKEFRRILNEKDLCPSTYFNYKEPNPFDNAIVSPMVVRSKVHAQGRQLWVVRNYKELEHRCMALGVGNYYFSDLIDKVAEYRVFVAQGRAAWVAAKIPGNPKDVAWNVAKGGVFHNVRWDDWPLKAVKTSIEAFHLSGLDFGGVDVMVDKDGDCFILEINSAPSLTTPYRQQITAKVFDYMTTVSKENIPLTKNKGGYLKFVHPAINDRAIIGE